MKPPQPQHQQRHVRTPGGRTPARRRREVQRSDSSDSSSGTDLDPVEVYCRIRPLDSEEKCVKMLDETTVQVLSSDPKVNVEMQYKFSRVFGETTSQKHLFDCVGAPLIDDLVRGKNGLLFTYGITSSGKTYTMTGAGNDQGILPRCLDMVFNSIKGVQAIKYVFMPDKQKGFDVQTEADAMLERQQREVLSAKSKPRDKITTDYSDRDKDPSIVLDIDKDGSYAVFVSFIEIYNNYVYDLLEELPYDPITGSKPPQSKILREDLSRVMFVHNVSEVEVKSTEEAFDILVKGQRRRKVAHTVLNAESSRSHSVFNIRLVQAPLDSSRKDVLLDKHRVVVSQLSLVDLAGSERTNRTKSSGDRLKEAGQINQSLMVLRQCIDTLRENQKNGTNKMVPYRDSKVTHLFKNYFDGEGKVRMIVCVNPKGSEYDETLHVMRFSEAAQEVQVHRAHDKPRFADLPPPPPHAVKGRRRLAPHSSTDGFAPPPAKKTSCERLPHAPVPLSAIYALPPFPPYEFNPADESTSDPHIIQDYLLKLGDAKRRQLEIVRRKQESFRQLLLSVDMESSRLRDAVSERDALILDQNREMDRVNRRLQIAEKEIRLLKQRNSLYEHEKKDLESEVAQVEVDYENQLQLEKKRIQQEAKEHLSVKDRKLRLLRNIMDQSDVDSISGGELARANTPTAHQRSVKPLSTTTHKPSYATPTTSSRGKGGEKSASATRTTTRTAMVTRHRARSPPASTGLRPIPVRNHRRSKSAGDRWLDHRPENIAPLNTVLQPKMKKKKSVGKLEVKDTNKASRYILTTQDADRRGQVETKLVKGEVRPSAGGGSSVVFTEVETLKQTSPGDRKRQYLPEGREDYEGEWTDTEERCNIAVEGHGIYKRIRQFDKDAGGSGAHV